MKKREKIVYIAFSCYFAVSVLYTVILSNRLERNRLQSEQLRQELARATNQQQILTTTINQCYDTTRRTEQILGESINTVAELRAAIKQIRENYEAMENCINNCFVRIGSNDDLRHSEVIDD